MKSKKVKQPSTKKLEEYMELYDEIHGIYFDLVGRLEAKMAKETGIPDIEFIYCDGCVCGIGNASRTMKLWQPK